MKDEKLTDTAVGSKADNRREVVKRGAREEIKEAELFEFNEVGAKLEGVYLGFEEFKRARDGNTGYIHQILPIAADGTVGDFPVKVFDTVKLRELLRTLRTGDVVEIAFTGKNGRMKLFKVATFGQHNSDKVLLLSQGLIVNN